MKLLLKISLFYLLVILVILGVGSLVSYRVFEHEIQVETDRFLKGRFFTLYDHLAAGEPARAYTSEKLRIDTLTLPPDTVGRASFQFTDTLVMHHHLKRMESNRKLIGYAQVDSTYLQLTLYDVIVESDDIMDGVIRSLTWLFVLLGGGLLVSTFLISRYLLKPFHQTLHEIKNFNVSEAQLLSLPPTNTQEFNQLNRFIEQMTQKMRQDYQRVKEFSENASHEIQTPLSVAKGKLELLSQSSHLTQEQSELLGTAYQAVDEVSKLARSLMLLTKIENKEFSDFHLINGSDQIHRVMADFEELLVLKDVVLTKDIADKVYLQNNPILFKILLNNLFNNAIRHNQLGGAISVMLRSGSLTVANTGDPLREPPEALFERFKKNQQSGESMGLGLAIVKKICDISNYQIQYRYQEGWHTVKVFFPTIKTSDLLQNDYPFQSESARTFIETKH